jgi:hypothetical protein
MKQGALPQEAMFKNNIFMKYYKKMQYPFEKRGGGKGENPIPSQEQLLGKRRKKRPQPIPLETSKPSPSHVTPKNSPLNLLPCLSLFFTYNLMLSTSCHPLEFLENRK